MSTWYAGLDRPTLSRAQAEAYAKRLGFTLAELEQAPKSSELLRKIQVAHHLRIPFDNSRVHIRDADLNKDVPIEWQKGDGLPFGADEIIDLVVHQRRGATCFQLHVILSAFLRLLGFRVQEKVARSNGNFPKADAQWTASEHIALFVSWEGSKERWLVDVGWNGNPSMPMLVPESGETNSESLAPIERYVFRKEVLPLADNRYGDDLEPGWTLYRVHDTEVEGHPPTAAPTFHAYNAPLPQADIMAYVHLVNSCSLIPISRKLVVNNVELNGDRKFIVLGEGDKEIEYYVRDGKTGEKTHVEHFAPTAANLTRYMREKLGMF